MQFAVYTNGLCRDIDLDKIPSYVQHIADFGIPNLFSKYICTVLLTTDAIDVIE